jgi:hypothetical protein
LEKSQVNILVTAHQNLIVVLGALTVFEEVNNGLEVRGIICGTEEI